MDQNNTTPSQNPMGEPTPPTEQPPQPQISPTVSAPQKSKMPLLITLIVILLAAGGAAAYFFFIKDSGNKPSKDTSNTQTQTTEEKSITSSLTNDDKDYGSGTISVTHPKDWKVETGKDINGANQLVVTSAAGNVLRITQQTGGVGGACDPDTYSYTLVKKITTKDPSRSFTEYNTISPDFPTGKLSIESFANAKSAHKALTEGQKGTDVCSNIGMLYPIVDGMFVKIENASGEGIGYDKLKSDTEFISMLETFTVTDDSIDGM